MRVEDSWQSRYVSIQRRITELVDREPGVLDRMVPACPEWSGCDVVAHLVGVATALASGEVDAYASDEWTAALLDARRDESITDLLSAWAEAARALADAEPVGGLPAAMYAYGDALVHEADIGAIAAGCPRVPQADVKVGTKSGIARWRPVLADAGLPPLRINVPTDRDWWLGAPSADAVVLEVDAYELFRLLYGRRSRAQVEAFDWSADPEPYLDAGLSYPFRWADRALVD